MGTLSVLACFVLALWLYRREARLDPHATAVLWLPTVWMMRCGSRGIDYWLGGGEMGRLDPLFLLAMILAAGVVLARRPIHWGELIGGNQALFLFYGYLLLSSLWVGSVESPFIKLLRPLGDFLMALIVVTDPRPREALERLFRRTAILLIPLSIALIKYMPQLGRLPAKHWANDLWIGVTTHKNPLGQLCVVAAIAFLLVLDRARAEGRPLRRERIAWLYLAMTAWILWADGRENSRSSTSILSLALAIGAFWFLGRMRDRFEAVGRTLTLGLAGIAASALALQVAGSSLQELVAMLMGKDATLSDRSYLWRDVWRIGLMNPFFGTGYGGFWVPELTALLSPEVNNGPMQAHNGYLETFAQLGFVGLGLLLLVIFSSLRAAVRSAAADFDFARARITLLLTVLLINYAEATFPRGTHLWWFLFLAVALSPPASSVPLPAAEENSQSATDEPAFSSRLPPAPRSAAEAAAGRSG